jgi:hypothetical protein
MFATADNWPERSVVLADDWYKDQLPESCEFASIDTLKPFTEEQHSVPRDEYRVSAVSPVRSASLLKQFAKDLVSSIVLVGRQIALCSNNPLFLRYRFELHIGKYPWIAVGINQLSDANLLSDVLSQRGDESLN